MTGEEKLEAVRGKKAFLIDLDGVVYRGKLLLPGVPEFLSWLRREGKLFRFVTNNSFYTPRELSERLGRMGVEAEPSDFYTSAMAAAWFCAAQSESPSAWAIGANGLFEALEEAGVPLAEKDPEFVIAGEALKGYGFESVSRALNFVLAGARLIATNADITGPVSNGLIPATGAMVAPIEIASGRKAYFVGKPNPLMLRRAMAGLGVHADEAVMIGDSMGTDIRGGLESGVSTVLVLSGLTKREDIAHFSYRPDLVLQGAGDIALP